MSPRLVVCLVLMPLTSLLGCSGGPPPIEKKPTTPVVGVIHIDGKPVESVQIFLHDADNPPSDQSTPFTGSAAATTDAAGKFVFATYEAGDGLPEGSYVISFFWDAGVPMPFMRDNDDPPVLSPEADSFNSKYGNPSGSNFRFTVEKDKPVDLGILELTTN